MNRHFFTFLALLCSITPAFGRITARQANGRGVTEAQAMRRALKASQTQYNGGYDEHAALQEAMRQSQQEADAKLARRLQEEEYAEYARYLARREEQGARRVAQPQRRRPVHSQSHFRQTPFVRMHVQPRRQHAVGQSVPAGFSEFDLARALSASQLQDQQRQRIDDMYAAQGRRFGFTVSGTLVRVPGDGECLFASLARVVGRGYTASRMREAVVEHAYQMAQGNNDFARRLLTAQAATVGLQGWAYNLARIGQDLETYRAMMKYSIQLFGCDVELEAASALLGSRIIVVQQAATPGRFIPIAQFNEFATGDPLVVCQGTRHFDAVLSPLVLATE